MQLHTAARAFLLLPFLWIQQAAFAFQASSAKDLAKVDYVFALDPEATEVRLEMTCLGNKRDRLTFGIPAWSPGAYQIVNYGKRVKEVLASDGEGKELPIARKDFQTWEVQCGTAETVRLSYTLPRQRFLRAENFFAASSPREYPVYQIDGPATFLYVMDRKEAPCGILFRIPEDWLIATGLSRTEDPHRFSARDYDTFIDCPTRIGKFEYWSFRIGKTPFEVALSGATRNKTDRQEFASRLARICSTQIGIMGDVPFDRYVFLLCIPGGGGLEHLNSTAIGLMDLTGSRPGLLSVWDSVLSHEFFHLWNVKRLRPFELGPFDYTKPVRTKALWLSEGVTSYYGDLTLARAGLITPRDWWNAMARQITQLQNNPARKRVSVEKSSETVWDGGPFGGGGVDYYNKGEILGFLLDIQIRDATENRKSLDDVMRALYRQCMETGRGFAEEDIWKTCEKTAGRPMKEWFDRYVAGTEELPYGELLPKAGLRIQITGERRVTARITEDEAATPEQKTIREGIVTGKT